MKLAPAEEKALLDGAKSLLKSPQPTAEATATDEAAQLRKLLNYLDWKYYVRAEQAVADVEYDQLFKKLRQIETDYPALLTEDSPTQRVARALTTDFASVRHEIPMLSLDNSYNEEDLLDWDQKVRDLTGLPDGETIAYSVEPKLDGSSISLLYENDQLTRAATRGNGTEGEDITNNVKVIRSIPLTAAFSQRGIARAEIRGEVVIDKGVFAQINEAREQEGKRTFQNPRNTAAGGLRMKDPAEVAQRGLEALLFQLGFAVDAEGRDLLPEVADDHFQNIRWLEQIGFKVPKAESGMKLCHGIKEVMQFINEWEARRDDYRIEIDGMVVKVNDRELQEKCGSTSHHPRWAMAYKFKAKQATSRLLKVEYQVGRTGAITPVAKLDPVALAGVTVSSVSLHNEDMIKEKDIRLGDMVKVERAGDVIPYISGVVPEARDGSESPIAFPTHCPSCNTALERPEEEVAWRCPNQVSCPAQAEERLIHFVSKGAMDIFGLGKDIVRRFINEGFLGSIPDIYRLADRKDEILALEGWKERSVEKLISGIETSKEQPLFRLINGLGIRHVGGTTAKVIVSHIEDIFDITAWKEEQLTQIEDIGPVVAASLLDYFGDEGNIGMLRELESLGVNTRKSESESATGTKLEGKTFLFTGSLELFSRDRAKELVEKNGGRNLSGVSKKLDYLVAGAKAGSKLKKAEAIPTITVLTEQAFLDMIQD